MPPIEMEVAMNDRTTHGALPAALQSSGGHNGNGNGSTKGNSLAPIDPPPGPDFSGLFPLMSSWARCKVLALGAPMANKLLLCRMHLTTSVVAALDMFKNLGLDPVNACFFAKPYPYAHYEDVVDALNARGATVLPDRQMTPETLDGLASLAEARNLEVNTVEDGANLLELILANHRLASRFSGGTEQTSRGVWTGKRLFKEGKLTQPLIALPTSEIKADFEGPSVAAAGLRAIQNLFAGECVSDWTVGVLGGGVIGKHTFAAFDSIGCDARVFDPDSSTRMKLRFLGAAKVRRSAVDAARGAHMLVGTAGTPTINADVLSVMRNPCVVGSMSSEQVEIDLSHIERHAVRKKPMLVRPAGFRDNATFGTTYELHGNKLVHVLFDGMPLNFSRFGLLCEKTVDVIVGWLALCALEISRGTYRGQSGILTTAADDIFRKHQIAEDYECIWS